MRILVVIGALWMPSALLAMPNTAFKQECEQVLKPTEILVHLQEDAVQRQAPVTLDPGAVADPRLRNDVLSNTRGTLELSAVSEANYRINASTGVFCARPRIVLTLKMRGTRTEFSPELNADKKSCLAKQATQREEKTLKKRSAALQRTQKELAAAMQAHYAQTVFVGPVVDLAHHTQVALEKNWGPYAQELFVQALFDLDWDRLTDGEIAEACTESEDKGKDVANKEKAVKAPANKAEGEPVVGEPPLVEAALPAN
jgi:hypothetical protein